ncbi:PH domain-containing protein [Clostridium peptidivorans]|uniref:PH domain-containing protein n=1 Tax=Clostridium peptidivorans TaxID=100174 RepID=UPI000BE437CA|nr:PH domain-containing protein [Clostridium peptidivorans]
MENYEKLNIKAKKSWFLGRFIFLVIIVSILVVSKYLIFKNIKYHWTINLIIGIIILLQLLNTFLYPEIEYKQWKYLIDNEKFEFIEGIYFIKHTVVPIERIQHINVTQGPINRRLNLANITINTAGGSFDIPNLEKSKAEELSEFLRLKVSGNLKTELGENNG